MLEWLKKKPSDKAIVALDIGSEAVKAILFTVEQKPGATGGEGTARRAKVLGFGKTALHPGDVQPSAITDIASVARAARESIRVASAQAGRPPQRLVLGITGEFIKGITSVLGFTREDKASKINLAELRNIVHKLEWRAFAESRKALADETGYPEIDIKLVSSDIVEVKIDKYKVSNPLGFQGSEVEMSIYNAFAPLGHFGAIQSVADELQLELLGIVSEPFALSRALTSEENQSVVCLDIGGASTDIAVVSGGTVVGTRTFGIGGRTFTKRMSLELNISFDEAEKLKAAYTADKLEQKSKKIIGDIIQEDVDTWLEALELALSDFNLWSIPPRILLCGGGTHLSEFRQTLNTQKWYKKLPFPRSPQAVYLTPKDIPSVVDEGKRIQDRSDIMSLALANEGVVLDGEESMVQKVLRKVISIMKV